MFNMLPPSALYQANFFPRVFLTLKIQHCLHQCLLILNSICQAKQVKLHKSETAALAFQITWDFTHSEKWDYT